MQRINTLTKLSALLAMTLWGLSSCWAGQARTALQAQKAVKKAVGTKSTPAPKKAAPAVTSPAAPVKETPPAHLRDPFAALVRTGDTGEHLNLPPGIAGLQVATLQLQGLVQGPNGMIAVVANPQGSVYFIHEGDHIFDATVEKIDLDKITFQQVNKDAFGRPVQREVVKRLYPIAGEEQ
jgi:Tfp pilus assembly protein PilP